MTNKFASVEAFFNKTATENQIATMPAYFEKAEPSGERTFDFVFSTSDEDRVGDVIKQEGWELREFKRNPISLAQHRRELPIGNVVGVGVREGKLRGGIKFAPKGASPIADQYHDLVAAGVLKATSVGFIPLEMEIRKDKTGNYCGYNINKALLSEISIVSVPCNSNCLLEARRKGIDIGVMTKAFHDKEEMPTWAKFDDLALAMRGLEHVKPARIIKSDGGDFAYSDDGMLLGEIVDGQLRITKKAQNALAKKNAQQLVEYVPGSREKAAAALARLRGN